MYYMFLCHQGNATPQKVLALDSNTAPTIKGEVSEGSDYNKWLVNKQFFLQNSVNIVSDAKWFVNA